MNPKLFGNALTGDFRPACLPDDREYLAGLKKTREEQAQKVAEAYRTIYSTRALKAACRDFQEGTLVDRTVIELLAKEAP